VFRHRYSNFGATSCLICGVRVVDHERCEICGVLTGKNHFGGIVKTYDKGILYLVNDSGEFEDWYESLVPVDTKASPLSVCEDCFTSAPRMTAYRRTVVKKEVLKH